MQSGIEPTDNFRKSSPSIFRARTADRTLTPDKVAQRPEPQRDVTPPRVNRRLAPEIDNCAVSRSFDLAASSQKKTAPPSPAPVLQTKVGSSSHKDEEESPRGDIRDLDRSDALSRTSEKSARSDCSRYQYVCSGCDNRRLISEREGAARDRLVAEKNAAHDYDQRCSEELRTEQEQRETRKSQVRTELRQAMTSARKERRPERFVFSRGAHHILGTQRTREQRSLTTTSGSTTSGRGRWRRNGCDKSCATP